MWITPTNPSHFRYISDKKDDPERVLIEPVAIAKTIKLWESSIRMKSMRDGDVRI